MPRYLASQVLADLQRKMVLVAGPRQVGKTTLALTLPGAVDGYLNWDIDEHRERILQRRLPATDLWVFDEIHKFRGWRNLLKGIWDGGAPTHLVECKLTAGRPDKSLRYLRARFPEAEAWQVHLEGLDDVVTDEGVRVAPAGVLLRTLV